MIRKPADWEPIEAIWLAWPHRRTTWPGHDAAGRDRFEVIEPFYVDWVRTIAQSHRVRMVVADEMAVAVERHLAGIPHVELVRIPTDDAWIRDYGANFVIRDQKLVAVSFRYNAWGGKYPPWDQDAQVAEKMADWLGVDVITSDLCLEGGALEFDGGGRLLTTPSCLRDPRRNATSDWNADRIGQELHRCFGVDEIVWVDGGGIAGDDTDGHIDQMARFIDRQQVVVAVAAPSDVANHEGLRTNELQLSLWANQTQPRVDVHRLPIPEPRLIDGQHVPQSHCNFLRLGPERILVPTFGGRSDDHALGLLSELTGIEAEPVDCRDLAWGLGTLHCASCEQPAVGAPEAAPDAASGG